ncbi:MAG: SDR family oxidoreductase [Bdellovibrionales bacterium]|nr:SDR family oxidoreductase [Bdellovibrionales bacterium]
MIVVTGASGQLGQLVISELLRKMTPQKIVAVVRDSSKVKTLSDIGINVRIADYNNPASLDAAFLGAKKILLISSNDIGNRLEQHRAVIFAAKKVKTLELFAYTSILKSNATSMKLAGEHIATEKIIQENNLPAVILRNGWYSENYLDQLKGALESGTFFGSAKEGIISAASRADYAEAAAMALTKENQAGKIYELAGDQAFTLFELANIASEVTGKKITYLDLPENDYAKALVEIGLPESYANIFADSDVGISRGDLFTDKNDLSTLINRKTTLIELTIKENLGNA